MNYGNYCGGYCYDEELSDEDQEMLLKEKQAILEAKLATVKMMLDKKKKKDNS